MTILTVNGELRAPPPSTAVSSEAWAKLRVWASVAGRGRLLLSGSVAHAPLETAVGINSSHLRNLTILNYGS